MKLMVLVFGLSFLTNDLFASAVISPEGRYACKIAYTELTDTHILPGDDFPRGSNLEVPLEREETLALDFSAGVSPSVVVVNPEALPNWLLINSDQAANQSSYFYTDQETHALVYTVDWPQTWYFGSRIEITTLSSSVNGNLKLNILLDDNDGWSIELKFVSCSK